MARSGAPSDPHAAHVIDAGLRIDGDITFSGAIEIRGTVDGSVVADPLPGSVLVVAAGGRVVGRVCAARVTVAGELIGPVTASDALRIEAGARVEGDIEHRDIDLAPGARVSGTWISLDGEPVPLRLQAVSRGPDARPVDDIGLLTATLPPVDGTDGAAAGAPASGMTGSPDRPDLGPDGPMWPR